MELSARKTVRKNFRNNIPDSRVKQCFQEYNVQDKVDALKNYFGINDSHNRESRNDDGFNKYSSAKFDVVGVKECMQPSVPSVFQVVANELRDTVRTSYWNKEIGKTIYLPPHLPAGCDPLGTTFGKTTVRDAHGVAEILKPRDYEPADAKDRIHALYRKSHNDYDPSEQVDRKYEPPFNGQSSFGGEKKKIDLSGKKIAKCIGWCNAEPLTLVSRRLADYRNRTESRIGRAKNRGSKLASDDALEFGTNTDEEFVSVADTLNEYAKSQQRGHNYCSEYSEKISKICESRTGQKIDDPTISSGNKQTLRNVTPAKGGLRCDKENLGDQTSAQALVSPNIFTQMGLSHVDFFKVRDYDEIRSIYENIGIHFSEDSFDVLWEEGLTKDCTGGVCIETFRNLLPINVLKNVYNNASS